MSSKPIAIIGAGLAGSTLGRCLLKHGIPFVIYENAAASRKYNYAITLQPRSYDPLVRILGIDTATFESKVSVERIPSTAHDPRPLRVHRQKLEDLIRQGLDVKWETKIDRLEKDGPNFNIVHDGKALRQHDLVIGADGVHSTVRRSILPHDRLGILPYVAINGKRRVEKDRFEQFYANSFAASSTIGTRMNDALLQVDVFDKGRDTVSINWVYSRKARSVGDELFNPDRPKSAATDIPEDFYKEISKLELIQPFKDVFDVDKLKGERLLSWLMRTTETQLGELQEAAEQGVMLIGDSAHAEPILGGEGANAAISDGIQLAEWIVNNGVKSASEWYGQKYAEWHEGVENSKRRIEDMHADDKATL